MNPIAPVTDISAPETKPALCTTYSAPPSGFDELWTADQRVRKHWQPLIQAFDRDGCEELARCRQEVTRILRENGVAYNIHGDSQGVQRNWNLDILPLIVGRDDWQTISAGLCQRAHLLDLIVQDLYGPRNLVASGVLPAKLVFAHPGFLRPCQEIRLPPTHQLLLYSADLARTADGYYRVLADHTQAPFGMGHTLENRTAMARVMPDLFRTCKVQRLSTFFRLLRDELAAHAPHRKEHPRIVLYAADASQSAHFEQAYLGAYLNYAVVQGQDLTVRNSRVWLKTLYGLKRVDIVLRMLDDRRCDPLELDPASQGGLAGLLEAVRRRHVAVANPLGTGILENPGLMAFLPAVARHLLDQELLLPSAPTWWCGEPGQRRYVLANLPRMVVKPIFSSPVGRAAFGSQLTTAQCDEWRQRIEAQPHLFVGQEPLRPATAPALVETRFRPLPTLMRLFALGKAQGGYEPMPGGIARSTVDARTHGVAERAGGILKDIWVAASQPQKHASLWLQSDSSGQAFRRTAALPSRTAENLFWVGRYAERAEMLARMLRTVMRRFEGTEQSEDEGDLQGLTAMMTIIRDMADVPASTMSTGKAAASARPSAPWVFITRIITDHDSAGSLSANLGAMFQAAQAVRERWSSDSWRIINDLETHRLNLQRIPGESRDRLQALDRLVSSLLAFSGLCMESMSRELGWTFVDMGRRIERALMFSEFIRRSLGIHYPAPVDSLMMEAALLTTENIITYRRRYRSTMARNTVLDLLLMDDKNPRALIFQLDTIEAHIADLPKERGAHRIRPEERLALEATTRLRLSDTDQLCVPDDARRAYPHLEALLGEVRQLLERLSEAISHAYFIHAPKSRQLSGVHPELGP
jgi:uncharacterized circularly permuted ATP-grasp superfamily protein/uncharacterized alpha-E superfamily protein